MIINLIQKNAEGLAQVGLHFLWQGTAIAILAALICRFVIKSPRHRATIHLFGLLALSLCVPLTWIMLKETPPTMTSQPAIPQPLPSESAAPFTFESTTPVASVAPVETPLPISVWIVGIYFIGLALMLLRVMRGYRWSHRIRKHGTPVSEALWTQALSQALVTMKLRAKPVMIWSEKVTSPVVTGILRPMIVLPVSLMSGLPPAQATAVLSHELAHLRRFDHFVVVFQRLFEALFFFHPAVWFLSRRLDQEREKACDDLVIRAGHNRADYAEALVTLSSDAQPAFALAAAKNTHLKERIFRILHHPQPTTVRVNRGGWLVIATSIAALVITSLSPAQVEEKETEELKIEEARSIAQKLQIKIPSLEFQNATVKEAVEFLRLKSIELDPDPDNKKRGLNIVFPNQPEGEKLQERTIDHLAAQNFTFMEALSAICMKTNLQFRVDGFAISLMPASADQISHRSWGVPANFIALIAAEGIPAKPEHIEDHLKSWGVTFGKSTSATLLAPTATRAFSMLVVKNSPENLDMIDDYVDAILKATDQGAANERVQKKNIEELGKIIIPELTFKNATLEEAISFLRVRSVEFDPAKKGVNINIFDGQQEVGKKAIINLDLRNIPLMVVLDYLCDLTKTRYKIEGRNIFILPRDEGPNATAPEAREYRLRRWITPPDFLKLIAGAGVPPMSKSIVDHLKARSVTFPEGTSGSYIPASRSLVVRNTPGNLSLIDAIVGSTVDPEKAREEAGMPVNPGARAIAKKLQIRIPVISFNNTTLVEAITFLRIRSIELDPKKGGVNFVVRAKPGGNQEPKLNLIHSLVARNFTFKEALDAICRSTNYKYQIDEFAVTLFPKSEGQFTQRLWEVPDNFIELIAADGIPLKPELIKDHLKARGVSFGDSTSAHFVLRGPLGPSKLLAINTPKNLNLIDAIVKSVFKPAKEGKKTPGKAKVGPMEGNLEDLNKIIIPKIRFEGSTLEETMEFLRIRALELDPAKKGVNINFFGNDAKLLETKIKQLHLNNVPLLVALRHVCQATQMQFKLEGRNISVFPIKE